MTLRPFQPAVDNHIISIARAIRLATEGSTSREDSAGVVKTTPGVMSSQELSSAPSHDWRISKSLAGGSGRAEVARDSSLRRKEKSRVRRAVLTLRQARREDVLETFHPELVEG
jgi:hypothetical protein